MWGTRHFLLVQKVKSDCRAAPVVFGPRTLRRTWGTRPGPLGFGVEVVCGGYWEVVGVEGMVVLGALIRVSGRLLPYRIISERSLRASQ